MKLLSAFVFLTCAAHALAQDTFITTMGNVELNVQGNGLMAPDSGVSALRWPHGSFNQYASGIGFWLGYWHHDSAAVITGLHPSGQKFSEFVLRSGIEHSVAGTKETFTSAFMPPPETSPGILVQQEVSSYGTVGRQDVVLLSWTIRNTDTADIMACAAGIYVDMDIQPGPDTTTRGGTNDRGRTMFGSVEYGMCWTGTDGGEMNKGFGYMGVVQVEAPYVDIENFITSDTTPGSSMKLEVRALRLFRQGEQATDDASIYPMMMDGPLDPDGGQGNYGMYMGIGGFNLHAGDSARVTYAILLAPTASGEAATGTSEDAALLDGLVTSVLSDPLASVQENAVSAGVTMAPQPVQDHLTITLHEPALAGVSVSVLDMTGRTVLMGTIERGVSVATIPTSDLAPGCYAVRITDGTGSISRCVIKR